MTAAIDVPRKQLGGKLLPLQAAVAQSDAYLIGVFGAWGSAKTYAACCKFLLNCLKNPWGPEYGEDQPFSIVIGLTRNVLKDSAYREIKRILPPELIHSERNLPDWELTLANGHRIVFRTVKGAAEGASTCGVLVDEVHLITDKKRWINYQSRARDTRARSRVVIAAGIPEHGWLQEVFDGWGEAVEKPVGRGVMFTGQTQIEDEDGVTETVGRMSVFMHAYDNPHLPTDVRATLLASVTGDEVRKYVEGRWVKPQRLIYYAIDYTANMVNAPGHRDEPVHVGFDVGDQSHVVFLQPRTQTGRDSSGKAYSLPGLHVVDDFSAEDMGTEELMKLVKARGWNLAPNRTKFMGDPTLRRDEIKAFRKVFPDFSLIRKSRKDRADSTETGYAAVNVALRDAEGRTRLTFSRQLSREKGSLLWAISKFRRRPNGHPDRDNVVDHASDAFRYPVAHLLPTARTKATIRPGYSV